MISMTMEEDTETKVALEVMTSRNITVIFLKALEKEIHNAIEIIEEANSDDTKKTYIARIDNGH